MGGFDFVTVDRDSSFPMYIYRWIGLDRVDQSTLSTPQRLISTHYATTLSAPQRLISTHYDLYPLFSFYIVVIHHTPSAPSTSGMHTGGVQ